MKLYNLILQLFILSPLSGETDVSNKKLKQHELQRNLFVLNPYREIYLTSVNKEKDKNIKNIKDIRKKILEKSNLLGLFGLKERLMRFLSELIRKNPYVKKNILKLFHLLFKNDCIKLHANQAKDKLLDTELQTIPKLQTIPILQTIPKLQTVPKLQTIPSYIYMYGNNVSRKRRNALDCFKEGSCINNMNYDIPVCYCDSKCRIFNDCCHDSHVTNELTDKEEAYSVLKLNYTSCILNVIPDFLGYNRRGYMFVTICPKSETRLDIVEKCEKKRIMEDDVPVTGNDGFVYKNRYCANCHGVTNFFRWGIKYDFTCKVSLFDLMGVDFSDDVIDMLNRESCEFSVLPPKMLPRPRVCWNIIPTSLTEADNVTECLRYQNPVLGYQVKFNHHLERNPQCINKNNISSCTWPANVSSSYSVDLMSAIINLNDPRNSNSEQCIERQKGTCRFEAIIENSELNINLKLLTNATSIEDISFTLNGLAKVLIQHFIPFKLADLPEELHRGLCYYKSILNMNDTFPCSVFSNCYIMNIFYVFVINESIPLQELADFYGNLNDINWTYIETSKGKPMIYSITTIRFASDMSQRKQKKPYEYEYCKHYNKSVTIHYQNKLRDQLWTNALNIRKVPEQLVVIAFFPQEGGKIKDKIDSYKLLSVSYSFTVWKRLVKETDDVHLQNIQIISSFVTMGLSSISLCATLIIRKCMNLSNNVAGKVSEHLMISMLFSHLLFMFGFGANKYHTVCLIIGILSHYVWLSCFTWMSTYTITLMKAMLKLNQNPYLQTTSQFSIYNYIIGYGFPFIIVMPSAILDLTNTFHIGYATETCFPSFYPVNMVVFIGPISISILINVVVLLVAGRKIYSFQQSINHSAGIETHSYWPVYLRFFIFSGLSWSLGIIAEATDNDILRILFIFLAGSHGFLFSTSLLISRQVITKVRAFKQNSTTSSVSTIDSILQQNQVQFNPNVDLDKTQSNVSTLHGEL